jgi:hypothetical protein
MNCFVKSEFWSDERIESLTAEQKLCILWLMTNQSRDIAGFVTKFSERRFTFETGATVEALRGSVEALRGSIEALPNGGYFIVNFIAHNFGKHGKISRSNKVLVAVCRYVEALPQNMQALFFSRYPELQAENKNHLGDALHEKPLLSPSEISEGVREKAEQSRVEQSNIDTLSHEEFAAMLDTLVTAYPRRTHYAETLKAAKACLLRHTAEFRGIQGSYERILAGTKAISSAIAQWTQAEQIKFVKPPHLFFEGDHWKDDPKFWISHKVLPSEELPSLGGRQASTKFTI